MSDPNNEDRTLWASAALDAFASKAGNDDNETLVIDLLADLMHYCDTNFADTSFDRLLEIGRANYEAEITPWEET